MGFWISAGLLALLAAVPVGIAVLYDRNGFLAKLLIGPVSIKLFPRKREDKQKTPKKERDKTAASQKKAKPKKQDQPGGSLTDFQGIIEQVISFLGAFRRRLLIKRLDMRLTLAGDDPCDLACNYGKSWAALGNVMPLLERAFRIRKRNLEVQCDFCADRPTLFADIIVVISIGRMLWIVLLYGIRILGEYLKLKNLRKGGNKV